MALRSDLGRLAAALLLTLCATSALAAVPTPPPVSVAIATPVPQPEPWTGGLLFPVDEEYTSPSASIPLPRGPLSLAEENMISRSSEGLFPRYLPDGSVMIDLQGRFQELAFARVGPDGRVHYDCFSDLGSLLEALSTPPAPAPVPALEDR